MLISIIVPIYGVDKYLNKCIESILSQKHKDIELILVDDGSPDSCPQICDEWGKKDKRVKVVHKKNGGVSSARNAGLDCANGDYVTFVDGDDFISDTFSDCVDYLVDLKYVCFSYYETTNSDTKVITPVKGDVVIRNPQEYRITTGLYNAVWSKFYNRKIIEDNKLRFDTNLKIAEDLKFNLDYLSYANEITFVNMPFYNYYQNDNSVMKNVNFNKIQNTLQVCEYGVAKKTTIKDEELLTFYNKLISQNILSVLFRSGVYTKEENEILQSRLAQIKKHLTYGDTIAKKMIILFTKVFGIKFTAKILSLFKYK